ncbi:MAG: heme o synthase [Nitrososphaerota archaeon]|nr:heme o synthase [Nitrososphaerota archaeon]
MLQSAKKVENYVEMIKPKVVLLLLMTGIAGMLVAYRSIGVTPSPTYLFIGSIALFLGSSGAEAITNYHDRDIDSIMERTKKRPIPSGRVGAKGALLFGIIASAVSVIISLWFNWLAALFMSIGLFDNVVVYSFWLKRRNWSSVIFGGISGGMPVLVGYSAIAGTISWVAVFMATLVVVWIPIHIWSLAIAEAEDYKLAGIPTLPETFGLQVAFKCVVASSIILVSFGVAVFWLATMSPYLIAIGSLAGAAVAGYAVKLGLAKNKRVARNLFKISSPYLLLVFVLVLVGVWYA